MKDNDGLLVTAMVALTFVLWLGFAVHRSPRFPGSLAGGMLGVSAALLMLVPLAYALVKRVKWLKEKVVARLPLPRLLAWHVYTSLIGAILAVLHSGHRFESWMGILLTTSMLVAIASGFVGRHFLRFVSQEVREQQESLTRLRAAFEALPAQASQQPQTGAASTWTARVRNRLAQIVAGVSWAGVQSEPRVRALELSKAMADIEYAITAEQAIKQQLAVWLTVHIAASVVFYVLLVLHIWSGVQYGLRWFA